MQCSAVSKVRLIVKIKIRSEHGLLPEEGIGDDRVHVEEQAGVTACKVGEISFWHGADMALDILG